MKGIIFNLLEQLVDESYGENTWDDVLDAAEVDGAYTALGNYDDSEFLAVLGAVATKTSRSTQEALRWLGRGAIPLLAASYSSFFTGHRSLETFLPTINDVIHAEVRKLYPGAETPWFEVNSDESGHGVRLTYSSARQLCALAEGLVEGAAIQFGEAVAIEQPACMLRGDPQCVLVCTLADQPA